MNNLMLEKYANLLIRIGINIQKNQILVINTPIECAEFARIIARLAYKEGAKDVVMNWRDEQFSKLRYISAPEEVFEEFPDWQKEFYISYARKGAAFLSIAASDPDLMKDVNPERMMKAQKASGIAVAEYRERLMSDKNVWCVASIPTKSWAKRVFPELSDEAAIEKLWETIFQTVRVDKQDPIGEWEIHKNKLKKNIEYLNKIQFKYLKYKNSIGTDFTIELPENHIWAGGAGFTPEGVEFIANMPTEEVFTLPKKTGVNGTVVASKPLNFNGNLIENFELTFKNGKVMDFKAEKGYEVLKSLINTDAGASFLGEVALVPYDSPISNSNILFYNTLFDENASCHLAFGKAYPTCIKDGSVLGKDELEKAGVNDSLVHEDFMIGTSDLEITGILHNGNEIQIFKKGNFTI